MLRLNANSEELFYQLGLRQFGNFHRLKLEPPPPIKTLIGLAVQAEHGRWKESGVDMEEEAVVQVSYNEVVDGYSFDCRRVSALMNAVADWIVE